MRPSMKISIGLLALFVVPGFVGCDTMGFTMSDAQTSPLDWGPGYSPGVNYYYLPDIEAYYDLTNRDFCYLDNGQWLFSSTLPGIYGGYDLSTAYVIALNSGVYQPWLHHHYYVSNYPRYYYHSLYSDADRGRIHGFNENGGKPFYWGANDKTRVEAARRTVPMQQPRVDSRPPQRTNYYGRNIGQPVQVRPNMRPPVQPRSNSGQPSRSGNPGEHHH